MFGVEETIKKVIAILLLLSSVSVWADYTYKISSGYVWDLNLVGNETLLMTEGGGHTFAGDDNSILDIRNTSFPVETGKSGIVNLMLGGNSQLKFSGGYVACLSVGDDATAVLSGGQIAEIWSYYFFPADSSHITVYCQSGWTHQNVCQPIHR